MSKQRETGETNDKGQEGNAYKEWKAKTQVKKKLVKRQNRINYRKTRQRIRDTNNGHETEKG